VQSEALQIQCKYAIIFFPGLVGSMHDFMLFTVQKLRQQYSIDSNMHAIYALFSYSNQNT